jgi:DMSO/TMAO reductase YedYZ molybdopterin-dependent catalytic subunit
MGVETPSWGKCGLRGITPSLVAQADFPRRISEGQMSDEERISRGFKPKHRDQADRERLPPGQHMTLDFPVLSAGPTPRTKLVDWSFTLQIGTSRLGSWNWSAFEALPQSTIKADIHCVTRWSKFDTTWQGVTFDDLLKAAGLAEPPALYVMAQCDGGYTTNLPISSLRGGQGMVATRFEGLPIAPAHGGPARFLVPSLYFWKSAKWIRSLRFMEKDERGFWERRGYHNDGDPWKEQRYSGD